MKKIIFTGGSGKFGIIFKKFNFGRTNIYYPSSNTFDITNPKSISELKKLIQSKYKTIDILINNAGMLINKPFVELSKKEFISVYDVNFFGVIELIQGILPFFKSNQRKYIKISLITNLKKNFFKGYFNYTFFNYITLHL